MAVAYSSFSLRVSPPKALVTNAYAHCGESNVGKSLSIFKSISSLSSSANYVKLRYPTSELLANSLVAKELIRRSPVWKCATIEEIEAEKSLIEKDVVITKSRMEKTLGTILTSFNAVRTGRANPAMLDRVMMCSTEYYGSPVSLKSIAQISAPDASSILVQPYDKSSLKAIEIAIGSSELDLTPNNDGEVIRLVIPLLTSERRKELSKVVAKQAEEGKVAIINVRRDAMRAYEKLEKDKKLSEDDVKDLSSDLQKLTVAYMKKVESLQKQKEKVILFSSDLPTEIAQ